jgi:S1-C subfamily serine protease
MKRYFGILFLILTALAAGAAGAAVILRIAAGSISVPQNTTTVPVVRPKPEPSKVRAAARGTVSFYRHRASSASLDAALLPADHLGNGVILTTDGWLMTAASVLAGRDQVTAIFADRSVATVDTATVITDAATGVAFIHVPPGAFSVAQFGDDAQLQPGDALYAVDPAHVRAGSVIAVRELPAQTRAEFTESTERLARRLIVSDASASAGTALVNVYGETVGIVTASGQAVPTSFVSGIFKGIFESRKAIHPRAGMHYVSIDQLVGVSGPNFPRTGALLNGAPAVERGSAADAAGLRAGDVIVSVERDRVDADHTLAEVIQQYAPGQKIELTALRAGKEMKVSLTLK